MVLNMLMLIQIFYSQKLIEEYHQNSKELIEDIWILYCLAGFYGIVFFYFLIKGPISLVFVKPESLDTSRKLMQPHPKLGSRSGELREEGTSPSPTSNPVRSNIENPGLAGSQVSIRGEQSSSNIQGLSVSPKALLQMKKSLLRASQDVITKEYWVHMYYLLPLASIVFSVSTINFILWREEDFPPWVAYCLVPMATLLLVTSYVYLPKTVALVEKLCDLELKAIKDLEDKHELKEDTLEVPYFLVKSSHTGSLYRIADRFDLLQGALFFEKIDRMRANNLENASLEYKAGCEGRKESMNNSLYCADFLAPSFNKEDSMSFHLEKGVSKRNIARCGSIRSQNSVFKPHEGMSRKLEITETVPTFHRMKNVFMTDIGKMNLPHKDHLSKMSIYDPDKSMKTIRPSKTIVSEGEETGSLRTDQVLLSVCQDYKPSNEELCFICCENSTNCVALPCLHGGICLKCSLNNWTRNKKCYLCKRVSSFL